MLLCNNSVIRTCLINVFIDNENKQLHQFLTKQQHLGTVLTTKTASYIACLAKEARTKSSTSLTYLHTISNCRDTQLRIRRKHAKRYVCNYKHCYNKTSTLLLHCESRVGERVINRVARRVHKRLDHTAARLSRVCRMVDYHRVARRIPRTVDRRVYRIADSSGLVCTRGINISSISKINNRHDDLETQTMHATTSTFYLACATCITRKMF